LNTFNDSRIIPSAITAQLIDLFNTFLFYYGWKQDSYNLLIPWGICLFLSMKYSN